MKKRCAHHNQPAGCQGRKRKRGLKQPARPPKLILDFFQWRNFFCGAHLAHFSSLGFVYNRRWLQYHPQQLSLSLYPILLMASFFRTSIQAQCTEISCAPHARYSINMNGCNRRRTDYKAKPAALHF
jgi:hypothetical protein